MKSRGFLFEIKISTLQFYLTNERFQGIAIIIRPRPVIFHNTAVSIPSCKKMSNVIWLKRTPGHKPIVIELSSIYPMKIPFNCSIVQSNPVATRFDLGKKKELKNIIIEKNVKCSGQNQVNKRSQ